MLVVAVLALSVVRVIVRHVLVALLHVVESALVAVVTAIWNVMPALVHAKETAMVAAVNVSEIVPAHVRIHVLVHAS